MSHAPLNRRQACRLLAAGTAAACLPRVLGAAELRQFHLDYALASCMYGKLPLAEVVGEVRKVGAARIDLWPAVHANQREQMEEMGPDRFVGLLEEHGISLGMTTRYDLGPLGLGEELAVLKKFGASLVVTGSVGPKNVTGAEAKAAVKVFVEQMKPHVELAEQCGVTIGIENHANALVASVDSIRYLAEMAASPNLGIALAPYHLPQDEKLLARLIEDLGPKLVHFYAWEHGKGCMEKLPKEQELQQMPGRGSLDFRPLLAALKKIGYRRWVEIFMHPVPRGIPIMDTLAAVTAEINAARAYLDRCLGEI
ncbi:MAG: sugar phosphate isomerase/epimerase family protein [Thermoguttaceae bacterium]